MKQNDESDYLSLYKSLLRQEVRSEKVQFHKQAFLKEHFAAQPLVIFQPLFWMPALTILLSVTFLLGIEMRIYPVAKPATILQQESLEASTEETRGGPRIRVKRLSSRVGPTLVYQKSINDLPVTIIWVFPKGGIGG